MAICEDYDHIARRLREIKEEALGSTDQELSSSAQATVPTRPADFNGWFWQIIGSTP